MAEAHLHMAIRASEVPLAAQQVGFAPEIDLLLAEIVRATR